MKKISLFVLAFVMLSITTAFAAGMLVKDRSKSFVPIQSIQGISPVPATSTCTTATITKGTIATVTPTGYAGLKWSATAANGSALVVKRKLNSNTAYMPESGGTITINSGITAVKFDVYSAASGTATTVCTELQ